MKILLTAINAKYIHSNPAVYSLRAYAGEELASCLEIAEYTINHQRETVLADIFRRKPDVVAISCYIWNWSMTAALIPELPKVLPGVEIWLGGPEVSYHAEEVLEKFPEVRGVMVGEGEDTFRELAHACFSHKELAKIAGIVYRTQEGEDIIRTPGRPLTNLSEIPFLYRDLEPFANRIIYYESSRGCPYRCSYCLSSIDKEVRLRDMEVVKKELDFFLEHRVKQVKFVDRTFNCNREHAREIWNYLSRHDNGVTNFHFEIAAELISDEELKILAGMRPGLIQMEIGVQTANPETLREIRRISDIGKLRQVVEKIRSFRNIHIHLDLIAGLPFEDYESFCHSFNEVYEMEPQQLQLGFLKVLKGSYLAEKVSDYGICYTDTPPYEVLSTKWLSYEKILRLKQVEEMVELYYNSGQFVHTLKILQTGFEDAFTMYLELADFYREKGYVTVTPSRSYRYQALLDFAMETELAKEEELLRELLTFDLYLRENSKSRPDFAADATPYKRLIRNFYEKEEKERQYLPAYADYDSRQLGKMTHMEVFDYPVWETDNGKCRTKLPCPQMVLFDYKKRDALTGDARYVILK